MTMEQAARREVACDDLAQVTEHPGEFHLRASGLKTSLHGGLDQALRLGGLHLRAEEIGIATEVVCRRKGDRVHSLLDGDQAGGWEPRDAVGERRHEIAEGAGRQGSIYPAVPLGELCVVVL